MKSQDLKLFNKLLIKTPDFPKKGVIFRDPTIFLSNNQATTLLLKYWVDLLRLIEFDCIVGLESRGFVFGMLLSTHYKKPFVPIRKKGLRFDNYIQKR